MTNPNINLQELQETYCHLGRLQGCDVCIVVEGRQQKKETHPHAVLYVGTNPFKPTIDVAKDIEATITKLQKVTHLPHYQALILDNDTFETLAKVASISY